MIKQLLAYVFVFLGVQTGIAQNIIGKIVDAESGENLSYASIQINEGENIVSNAEGNFTLSEKNNIDGTLLTVSFLGYKSAVITLDELKENNFIIRLQPGVFELETVYVSNGSTNADSIMVKVKKNLALNYKNTDKPVKRTLFYREGNTFKPVKLKAEMTKSTGYKKRDLKASNAELNAFTSKLISYPPQEFTDMLCNYYTAKKTVNDKSLTHSKFEVVKAVKLKDKNRSVDLKELQQRTAEIVFKHLDSTKYYRVKSGLFGTRDTVLYGSGFNSKKDKELKAKQSRSNSAKSMVMSFMTRNNLQNSNFDFVTNLEFYEYTYTGATQTDDNEFIYTIKFRPRKRKGKYAGTLYVSEKDYAVIRADYSLAEGKTLGGINLKFLLGVKQLENVSNGTLIFKEREGESGYYLQYASIETGSYIYINRPLKFIEITEGDKDEVAFDIKVEANMVDREEFFVMSHSSITESEFDTAKEEEFNYIELDSYDPNTWKEYTTIEPIEEMKQFKTVK